MNEQDGKTQIKNAFTVFLGFKYGIYIINWKRYIITIYWLRHIPFRVLKMTRKAYGPHVFIQFLALGIFLRIFYHLFYTL